MSIKTQQICFFMRLWGMFGTFGLAYVLWAVGDFGQSRLKYGLLCMLYSILERCSKIIHTSILMYQLSKELPEHQSVGLAAIPIWLQVDKDFFRFPAVAKAHISLMNDAVMSCVRTLTWSQQNAEKTLGAFDHRCRRAIKIKIKTKIDKIIHLFKVD